ncbi:hypothetical protein Taro_052492 [Colocasia esculenta]|uniref:Uncharacterized protein n=1 Tax=Colocasia esculenta TaxID=4460 RepID=A0A843XKD8_COLES|nr:hypothetical protein [Colocasia esculenta]
MAESVVTFHLEKLGALLSSKLDLVIELNINIRSLQNDLALLQAFLKDVDARQRDSQRVKVWISQVRNVAFQAEDAIDRYLYEVEFPKRHGFLGSLENYANHARRLRTRHHLGTEIEGINKMLQKITASRLDFGIEFKQSEGDQASNTQKNLHKLTPTVEETDVVGFEQDVEKLRENLLAGDQCAVVSIVEMGGLGKTTLARKVCNSDDIKKHFDCQAWVYISQKWDNRELLQSTLEKFVSPSKEEIAKMNLEGMASMLRAHLRTKRYLLVIDDIWDKPAWDAVRGALPEGKDGSRIIVTTRREEVARYIDPQGFIHKPQCLGEGKSWDLFCLRAFGSKGGCPEGLRELGKEMVSECAGLPLAITVLGGLLSRKQKSEVEWRKVLKRITYELHEGEDGQNIQRILALSYDALPYYLRSCFLYFGLFPEDSEINAEELIQLWVAEGFIQVRGQQTMEEVAEDYLEELVDRSMIQVVGQRNLTGGVKKCRIHDLMLDLSISQGEEEKFLGIVVGNYLVANNVSSAAAPRRVAVHSRGSFSEGSIPLHPSWLGAVRSMFWYFNRSSVSSPYQMPLPTNDLKLLRVLNVKGSKIRRLPKQIGLLVHLRFLRLKGTLIATLPSSIGMLRNLETLRVHCCLLPSTIWKVETLRHAIGFAFRMGRTRGKDVDCKANLQTLWGIQAGSGMGRCLGEFTNLRVLKICEIPTNHATMLARCLEKMTYLNRLKLHSYGEEGTIVAKSVLEALAHCRVLYELVITWYFYRPSISCSESLSILLQTLAEKIERKSQFQQHFPEEHQSLHFPSSLIRLKLDVAGLFSEEDGLASLQCLPNLKILKLCNDTYSGKVMVFSPQGFTTLEELHLQNLAKLVRCTVGDGAMPRLKHLILRGYGMNYLVLKTLPEELQHITRIEDGRGRRRGLV